MSCQPCKDMAVNYWLSKPGVYKVTIMPSNKIALWMVDRTAIWASDYNAEDWTDNVPAHS